MPATALRQVPEHYVTEFSSVWDFLTQQRETYLRESVTIVEDLDGDEKRFNQMGQQEMQRIGARAQKTQNQDVPLDQRWLRVAPYDVSNVFDRWDEKFLGRVVLPDSEVMQSHVFAYNRLIDDVVIATSLGVAYSGPDGITSNSLPASQQVAVDFKGPGVTPANTQLTLPKLISAKGIFGRNEVDPMDKLTLFYNQQALDAMLYDPSIIASSDYAAVKALVDGSIDYFMGMKWVKTERLPVASNVRSLVVVAKSGIRVAPGTKINHIDILPEHSHALQIRSEASIGGTRMEELKVVEILCDETAAIGA